MSQTPKESRIPKCEVSPPSKYCLYWTKLRQPNLLHNTIWMFLGQGMRQLLRAGYFLLIPRSLGPHEYGVFVGVTSLVAILAPFSTIGIGNLLVKNVARDKSLFYEYWGNSLLLTAVSGSALVGLAMLLGRIVLPVQIPWLMVFLVALSDLIFVKILDLGCQAFQAFDLLGKTAQLNVYFSLARLAGALILIAIFHRATAMTWTWFYLVSTVVCCVCTIKWVHRALGSPRLATWRIKPELAEGCYFAVSFSSQSIYNDIDKTMLVQLSTLDAAGIYAAAYRLIDVAFLPVRSLLWATYPTFFRHGRQGIQSSWRYAVRLLPRAGAYSLLASVLLFLTAPMLPYVLGSEYARTVSALRWLAPLPVLKTFQYFLADSLTGAGLQSLRTAMQVGVAIFNIGLNLWLIPAFSWRGAAWSSLASDGLLAVGLWMIVYFLKRQQPLQGGLRTSVDLA